MVQMDKFHESFQDNLYQDSCHSSIRAIRDLNCRGASIVFQSICANLQAQKGKLCERRKNIPYQDWYIKKQTARSQNARLYHWRFAG